MDKDNSKLLASLAVFRELYDSEKDIYSIIASFLNDLIRKEKLNVIGINEITEKLNSEFEFDIPSAVVKTSLKRLDYLQNLGTHFIVTDFSKIRESNIESKQKDSIVHNNEILLSLYDFIERKSYKIGAPCLTTYQEIFNSDDCKYGGKGIINTKRIKAEKQPSDKMPFTIEVDIPPLSVIVLKYNYK